MRKLIKFVSALGIVVMLSVMVGMTGTAEAQRRGSPRPDFRSPIHDLTGVTISEYRPGYCADHPEEQHCYHIGADYYAVDYGGRKGLPIYPTLPGKVIFTGCGRDFGCAVVIDHGDIDGKRLSSLYAHLEGDDNGRVKSLFAFGSTVKQSDIIGYMSDTGIYAKGVHLHFAVRDLSGCKFDKNGLLEGPPLRFQGDTCKKPYNIWRKLPELQKYGF